MREMLSHRRLVNERPTRCEHARDLVQRTARTRATTAYVIAGTEVDHEVEAAGLGGQRADEPFGIASARIINGISIRSCSPLRDSMLPNGTYGSLASPNSGRRITEMCGIGESV